MSVVLPCLLGQAPSKRCVAISTRRMTASLRALAIASANRKRDMRAVLLVLPNRVANGLMRQARRRGVSVSDYPFERILR